MRSKNIIESFNHAIEGIIYAFKTQRNMKIHFVIAFLVLMMSLFFDLNKLEFLILLFAIAMVLISELFNTAIEAAIDMITDKYHPIAAIAKDVAAGAVFISAVNAIVVGYILFFYKSDPIVKGLFKKVKDSPPYLIFVIIAIIMLLTVVLKAYLKEGQPLRGGMPSGHSAIAFGIATFLGLYTENVLITTLAYFMALLVVQSRVEGGIHDIYEVIAGALLGTAVSVIIYHIRW